MSRFDEELLTLRDANTELQARVAMLEAGLDQKRDAQTAHENEARYHLLFDMMDEGAAINEAVLDENGEMVDYVVLEVNPAFEEHTIYKAAETVGRRATDVYKMSSSYIRAWWREHDGLTQAAHTELHHEPSARWFTITTTPIRGSRFITIFRDITGRRQAEETLAQERSLMTLLMDTIPDHIYFKDRDSRVIRANRAVAAHFGLSDPAQAVGKTDFDFFSAEHARQAYEDEQEIIRTGRPLVGIEEKETWPGGTVTWASTTKMPLCDRDGRVNGTFGISRDITQHKRDEEALRQSEAKLRAVLDATPFPIAVVDLQDDQIQFWSRSALALFGHTAPTAAGWYQLAYPDPDYRRQVIDRWRPVLDAARRSGRTVNTGEYRVTCSDGSVRTCELHAAFLADSLIVTFNDITGRTRAEAERDKLQGQLMQALKLESIGRLAGGVAHDFNNMLGVILGHAELSLEQVDPAQPLYADLLEIQKAAQRSADLTRQLLSFARRQTVAPKVMDLNATVADMLRMLQRLIGEEIELVWRPGPRLWLVSMDPAQLDQIFANLCVNARDAITGVGSVILETGNAILDAAYCAAHPGARPGEYVLLVVSDDGCGMDAEALEHLFEPFFTTKESGRGTGLGLATVYGAVKQNQGHIAVQSAVGVGTTFWLYLPRHLGPGPEGTEEIVARAAQRGTETVLLVEDEPGILTLAETMLKRSGYRVLAAGTPREALRLAGEEAAKPPPSGIDLLLTDVVMPEMNGRELAREIQGRFPRMKRLYMSGYTADVIASRGVVEEGVCFVQKPFALQELAAKVREALDESP